jgi:hypothetical protein
MQSKVYSSILFPSHSISEARSLLHTPESWGTGPLLLFGIPPFTVQKPRNMIVYEDEAAILFRVLNKELMLKSNPTQDKVQILFPDESYVSIRLNLIHKDTDPDRGYYLNVLIVSKTATLWWDTRYITQILKDRFFSSINNSVPLLPSLNHFREITCKNQKKNNQ